MEINWNILYVDTDVSYHATFAALINYKYKIYFATNTQECLRHLRENEIHLVIMDQSIVEKAGIKFVVSTSTKYPKSMVIITGPSNEYKLILDALNSGRVYRFIPKPWEKSCSLRIIDEALNAFVENMANDHLITDLRYFIY